jgi:peptidoglycan/LPS O-acetylase OafA/YrhL
MQNKKFYQPEIDSLRFLAVFPVIIFHLDLNFFNGGFLGVDIFFVISGYLITKIIMNDLEKKKFSILEFYLRRARRILPALISTVFLTVFLSFLFFFPEEFKYLYKTIISVIFFVSNFFFFKTTNYFDDLTTQSPLLHTWSLAVEEQFYIIYPIFLLIFLNFFNKKYFLILLLILFFLSISLATYFSLDHQDGSFFLTPFRIFEIIIGCILSLYNFKKILNLKNHKFLINLICIICFFNIFYSFIFFSKQDLLPSYLSLIPILSTSFLIIFLNDCNKKIYSLISNRYLVFLGKISYSLYLIHIPLITFFLVEKNVENIFIFFIVLFTLSILSWKYIENPFRNKKIINNNLFIKIIFSSIVFIFIFTLILENLSKKSLNEKILFFLNSSEKNNIYTQIKKVRKETYNFEQSNYDSCKIATIEIDKKFEDKFKYCKNKYNKKFVLFLGDSHARDLFLSYTKIKKNDDFVVGFLPQGCRPALNYKECIIKYESFKNFIIKEKNNIKLVIYTQSGSKFLKNLSILPIEKDVIVKTINYLKSLDLYEKLLWIGPNVEPNIPMNFTAVKIISNKKFSINENRFIKNVDTALESMTKKNKINYISRIQIINYDSNIDFYVNEKFLTYIDNDHWSSFGYIYFGTKLFLSDEFNKYISR